MSSTILNALNAKEEKLQVKKDKALDIMRDLESKRDMEISAFVKNYFEGIETNLEEVVYEDSTSYMEISCKGQPFVKEVWDEKKDDYVKVTKYGKDRIATIYFDGDSWSSKDQDRFINMGISTYSASDKYSQFQLDRFMYIGEVAKVIADFKDDILAGMNKIYEDKKKAIQKANLENAYFHYAELHRANLQNATLTGAKLQDAELHHAKLQNEKQFLAIMPYLLKTLKCLSQLRFFLLFLIIWV